MAEFLLSLHSGVRYLVLVAAVIAILVALVRLKAGTIGRPGEIAGAAFTGVLDLQVLLGIGVMLTRPFYPALIGHVTMMVLAAVVAHVTAVILRRRPPEQRRAVIQLVGFLIALAFVIGGIRAIGRSVL